MKSILKILILRRVQLESYCYDPASPMAGDGEDADDIEQEAWYEEEARAA